MQTLPLTRDLLLIGGGHAHALVLRAWGMRQMAGVRVTVVNPGPTAPYTGMLPGHVAGHYTRDELDIDLIRLGRFAGARVIDGAVDALEEGRAHVAGRGWIAFDVASIDIGIHAEMPEIPGFAEHAVGAKPLDRFARAWRAFRDRATNGKAPPDIVVIGGGVGGVELSMAMAHALRDRGPRVSVLESDEALSGLGPRAQADLRAAMNGLGVTVEQGARVARIHADSVDLEDGRRIPAAFVTGAAGARPHRWVAGTDLPLEEGFIRVTARLQVEGRPNLFAAGDCAHLTHAPRPKAGVYAVRAAPVLHDNLRAALSDGVMKRFEPQRTYLKLISLGDKAALGQKGGISVSGRWLWQWKDRIDRRFMDKLTDLPVMQAASPPAEAPKDALAAPMLCAGCGSKVGGGPLGDALAALPAQTRDDILSRPGDDAAVLSIGGRRQVLTTDHLRAFTEDPWLMARIAAVHALGDIWAMGAAPQAALASLVLPRMSEPLQARTLAEIMGAASEVFRDAGAEIVGGHTTMGAEATYGFTVTGLAEKPIGHDGARPDDALILTRAIGSGTLLAAEMQGRAKGRDVVALFERMATPQGDAAAILSEAHAMTDVTGFGLGGHLWSIARASGVAVELDPGSVPLYPGAEELAADGIRSSLYASNVAAAPIEGLGDDPRAALIHDPQTCGGLLAAIPAGQAEDLVERLRGQGHDAARIGTVTKGAPGVRAG
ncbi:selenide, water dikinase SelD [Jannaschia aquimarina]|uniref:SelD protein n=1 Tax=Jannaschia aquimarina TaxID=935700 RepID=A0A0D1EBW2_9RHOB|nr:selenide, water dikinase SelD [Jannaschia aquimarina]KIT15219.1 Selenide, water dikinase [Jannaschia aquimarina]SNT32747.1 selenophosphate synthase [Jannaschia aquimarina]